MAAGARLLAGVIGERHRLESLGLGGIRQVTDGARRPAVRPHGRDRGIGRVRAERGAKAQAKGQPQEAEALDWRFVALMA